MDEKLRLINPENRLVDSEGRLVDEFNRYINDKGEYVDKDGNLVDKDGDYVADFKPFTDDDGNPIAEKEEPKDVELPKTPPVSNTVISEVVTTESVVEKVVTESTPVSV